MFLLANFGITAALAARFMIGIYVLQYSPLGFGMLSVRDDIAAAGIGANVWTNRFIIACGRCQLRSYR